MDVVIGDHYFEWKFEVEQSNADSNMEPTRAESMETKIYMVMMR